MNEISHNENQTTERRRYRWWLIAKLSVLLIIISGFVWNIFHVGIRVTVQNTGQMTLHSVILHVSGNSYSLGNLAPDAFAVATVEPKGESHLEIEFTDSDGKMQRLAVEGYFETNYRGTIRVSIKDGVIDQNEQQFHNY